LIDEGTHFDTLYNCSHYIMPPKPLGICPFFSAIAICFIMVCKPPTPPTFCSMRGSKALAILRIFSCPDRPFIELRSMLPFLPSPPIFFMLAKSFRKGTKVVINSYTARIGVTGTKGNPPYTREVFLASKEFVITVEFLRSHRIHNGHETLNSSL